MTLYSRLLERTYRDLAEAYKKLYGTCFMPPKGYPKALGSRTERVCQKYDISRSII